MRKDPHYSTHSSGTLKSRTNFLQTGCGQEIVPMRGDEACPLAQKWQHFSNFLASFWNSCKGCCKCCLPWLTTGRATAFPALLLHQTFRSERLAALQCRLCTLLLTACNSEWQFRRHGEYTSRGWSDHSWGQHRTWSKICAVWAVSNTWKKSETSFPVTRAASSCAAFGLAFWHIRVWRSNNCPDLSTEIRGYASYGFDYNNAFFREQYAIVQRYQLYCFSHWTPTQLISLSSPSSHAVVSRGWAEPFTLGECWTPCRHLPAQRRGQRQPSDKDGRHASFAGGLT